MSRADLARKICDLTGNSVELFNPGAGWPALARVRLSDRYVDAALHVSRISSHARKLYEFRLQNPADRTPVAAPGNSWPIIVGYYDGALRPVLVAVDGTSRVGREARFSILFHQRILSEAQSLGWSEYLSSTGERITAFHPSLLPTFVELLAQKMAGVLDERLSREITTSVAASGLLDDDNTESRERIRRSVETVVRHYAFGRNVVCCYEGFCAMCGIDSGLVVGAHIYPASAPESPDKVWNGLALCHNHHAAFDAHKIWVEPVSKKIVLHPALRELVVNGGAQKAFVENTYSVLSKPVVPAASPREDMFGRRYDYYVDRYSWLP